MAVKFFRFDFGKLAAVDGSLGMIWSLDKTWTPVGGSAALARLRTHNQNRTVAARAIADMKTFGHLS